MPTTGPNLQQAVWLSLLMVGFGSTAVVATRFAAGHASVVAIVTVQYAICLLFTLPVTLRDGPAALATSRLGLHLFRGIAGVLGFYLYYQAVKHIPLADAMLLRQSAPLCVPVVLWLWQRQHIARQDWLPLLVGFAGIGIILRPDPQGLSGWHLAGFLSAVTLAISMVATGRLGTTESTARILFYYFALSLACVAPFSVGDWQGLPLEAWLAMLFVGVAMYFTLHLYTRAYSMAPAHAIAPINYLAVVAGGLWGWLLWDEVPDGFSLLGSVLVVWGGLLTVYRARRPLGQK